MKNHIYDMEGLAQENAVITRTIYIVISQLDNMTATMNTMQAQLNTSSAASKNLTRPKRKYYSWRCRRNFSHGIKERPSKKPGHKDEA